MKRRDAIKNAGLFLGGAAFSTITLSSLAGCQTNAGEGASGSASGWKPDYLSVDQGAIVRRIADILIPTTDTPGAIDAGVPEYINMVARDIMKPEEQESFKQGFAQFAKACQAANGKSFVDCTAEEQLSFLQKIEQEASESKDPSFIEAMKNMTYRGFFTSEEGMTEVLNFDPVPGNYDGCISLEEAGGAWAM